MASDPDAPLSEDWNDFCFIDTETRSPVDVTVHGAYRHTAACDVIIVTYAIGDVPVAEWCVENFDARLNWLDAPAELRQFHERVLAGEAWYVAHNAAFDRLAMSRGIDGCNIAIGQMIDSMAQVVKSHLPADLLGASQWGGVGTQKQTDGKRLIRLFSDASSLATPESNPEDWQKFLSYARDDVDAMRALFKGTLPLTLKEWRVYWATERMNDRGVAVDMRFVEQAAALSDLSSSIADTDIRAVTGYGIGQSGMLLSWVRKKLAHLPEADAIMLREVVEEPDSLGDLVKLQKHSLDRGRVTELIAMLERIEKEEGLLQEEIDALEALEIKEWGASATPKKFGKMLLQHEDGRLKGQFVFNGAPATGRWSSRGIQLQNLGRSTVGKLDDELDAVEIIENDGVDGYEALKKRFGPVGRTLSRLLRPAIIPSHGCKLLSSDYSAIEARVLPWLAGSEGAEDVLVAFRENDADPSLPDIYKRQAGLILGKDPLDVTKDERQGYGKVPVLALGFGGGNGALFAMAAAYGVSFTEDEATSVVRGWRETNGWAVRFWDALWNAAEDAIKDPGEIYTAGKISYVFIMEYMHGTLFCILPNGQSLLYPRIKKVDVEKKDKITGEVRIVRNALTYQRGRGRGILWNGLLAENVTQAVAGALIREALLTLDNETIVRPVMLIHDEIVAECDEHRVAAASEVLASAMVDLPVWADGLPVKADPTAMPYFSKLFD